MLTGTLAVVASIWLFAGSVLAEESAGDAAGTPSVSSERQPRASHDNAASSGAALGSNVSGETALDERAQRHWGSGMAYLDEDEYTNALEAFEKAFELSGRPRILLAIAVTHERRGDLGRAIATLDEYLRLAPAADNAAAIRVHRDKLQAQHDEQVQKMTDAERLEDQIAAPSTAATGSLEAGPSPREPADYRDHAESSNVRWTALGVGVASGVAATVSGLLAWQKYGELDDGCGASGLCSERETQSARTMAWVSTVLSGVAVAGLGVGIWLTLDEPDAPSEAKVQPLHVKVAYRPLGLTSEVSWSF